MTHPYDNLVRYDPAVDPKKAAEVSYAGEISPEVLKKIMILQEERSRNAYDQLKILSEATNYWDEFRKHCDWRNLRGAYD